MIFDINASYLAWRRCPPRTWPAADLRSVATKSVTLSASLLPEHQETLVGQQVTCSYFTNKRFTICWQSITVSFLENGNSIVLSLYCCICNWLCCSSSSLHHSLLHLLPLLSVLPLYYLLSGHQQCCFVCRRPWLVSSCWWVRRRCSTMESSWAWRAW